MKKRWLTDVEQKITALAGDVHEVPDQGFRAFPILVVALEAPGVARLPVSRTRSKH